MKVKLRNRKTIKKTWIMKLKDPLQKELNRLGHKMQKMSRDKKNKAYLYLCRNASLTNPVF